MRIGLVAASGRRVDVPHHGRSIAGRQHRRSQSLLQLLLLFAILGPAVLEPDLMVKRQRDAMFKMRE